MRNIHYVYAAVTTFGSLFLGLRLPVTSVETISLSKPLCFFFFFFGIACPHYASYECRDATSKLPNVLLLLH